MLIQCKVSVSLSPNIAFIIDNIKEVFFQQIFQSFILVFSQFSSELLVKSRRFFSLKPSTS